MVLFAPEGLDLVFEDIRELLCRVCLAHQVLEANVLHDFMTGNASVLVLHPDRQAAGDAMPLGALQGNSEATLPLCRIGMQRFAIFSSRHLVFEGGASG